MKLFVSAPVGSIVRRTFFTQEACAFLETHFTVSYSPLERHLLPEEFKLYAADADVIMTGWSHPRLSAKLLEGTNVRIIAHTGGSVADYVTEDIFDSGIRVLSCNGLYAESVAEGVLAYMLFGLRAMQEHTAAIRSGGWEPERTTEGLLDQTVGLVGMGAVSRELLPLLKAFRVKLKLYSRYPIDNTVLKQFDAEQVSLDELFSTCRVVSLHSALQPSTRSMIRKHHFDLLQDGALFLNTARSGIVHQEEMLTALKENRFRAVLDVFDSEPLPADHVLRSLPNVYCFPHKAGPTFDRRPAVVTALAEDALRISQGLPPKYAITKAMAERMTTQK